MTALRKGRILLGAAFLGLVAVAGAMLALEPDQPAAQTPEPVRSAAVVAAPASQPSPRDERFVIKRILPINGPIRYGEWHWDETGVPDGPIVLTVDLQARVISVFRNGYEIGAAAVLIGSQEKPTPTGVFPITEKRRHHVSNLYDAPMPYMQRLTNDGVALHSTKVEWGYASRGCIGMPDEFAARVFAATRVGDKVYITDGKTAQLGDSLIDS